MAVPNPDRRTVMKGAAAVVAVPFVATPSIMPSSVVDGPTSAKVPAWILDCRPRGHVGAASGVSASDAILDAFDQGYVDPADYAAVTGFQDAGPFETDRDAVRWLADHRPEAFGPRRMPEWDGVEPTNADWARAGYDTLCDDCGEETARAVALVYDDVCVCEDCTTLDHLTRAGDTEVVVDELVRLMARTHAPSGRPVGLAALDPPGSFRGVRIPVEVIEIAARVHYGTLEIEAAARGRA